MEPLRQEIDLIDDELIKLLEKRFKITSKIGDMKREKHLAVLDNTREIEILEKIKTKDPLIKEELEVVYKTIFEESKKGITLKQHPVCPFKRIQIIGLGLIGGSILKNVENLIVTEDPDLIILASPLDTIIPIAKGIKTHKPLVVMDVGSVKLEITEAFEGLTHSNIDFVSTHPLSGKEVRGFENSSPTLFINAPWVITPHAKNQEKNLNKVRDFIEFLGAKPICMSAEDHDRQAALISHLPGLLSRLFFKFVNEEDPSAINIAGPGFKSFTRLAHDNPDLRAEIERMNRAIILKLGKKWIDLLNEELG